MPALWPSGCALALGGLDEARQLGGAAAREFRGSGDAVLDQARSPLLGEVELARIGVAGLAQVRELGFELAELGPAELAGQGTLGAAARGVERYRTRPRRARRAHSAASTDTVTIWFAPWPRKFDGGVVVESVTVGIR